MLNSKRYWTVVVLLAAGFSFLVLPDYSNYCERYQHNDYGCAAYEMVVTFGAFIDNHGAAVTAIATGVIAYFTITLSKIGNQQIKDTRTLQRAFISVEPGGTRRFEGAEDKRIACDVIIHNTGNLAAQKISWELGTTFSDDPYKKDFGHETLKLVGDIVIGARVKARKGSDPVTTTEFNKWRDNAEPDRAWLYVWGRIRYYDGFRDGRFIDFCHRYNLRGTSGYDLPAENGRYHEHGNRTDEG